MTDVPATDSRLRTDRLVDEGTEASVRPSVAVCGWSRRFRAGGLDDDRLRWYSLRLEPGA